MADVIFLAGLTCLLIHELDAIQQQEWRFFFGWLSISDQAAYRLFTALHAPLLVIILLSVQNPGFQLVFDLFLIIHAGLHWALRQHPAINFNSAFSAVWIYGGAALGMLHLVLLLAA